MSEGNAVAKAAAINGLRYLLMILGAALLGYGAATKQIGLAIAGLIVVLVSARQGT